MRGRPDSRVPADHGGWRHLAGSSAGRAAAWTDRAKRGSSRTHGGSGWRWRDDRPMGRRPRSARPGIFQARPPREQPAAKRGGWRWMRSIQSLQDIDQALASCWYRACHRPRSAPWVVVPVGRCAGRRSGPGPTCHRQPLLGRFGRSPIIRRSPIQGRRVASGRSRPWVPPSELRSPCSLAGRAHAVMGAGLISSAWGLSGLVALPVKRRNPPGRGPWGANSFPAVRGQEFLTAWPEQAGGSESGHDGGRDGLQPCRRPAPPSPRERKGGLPSCPCVPAWGRKTGWLLCTTWTGCLAGHRRKTRPPCSGSGGWPRRADKRGDGGLGPFLLSFPLPEPGDRRRRKGGLGHWRVVARGGAWWRVTARDGAGQSGIGLRAGLRALPPSPLLPFWPAMLFLRSKRTLPASEAGPGWPGTRSRWACASSRQTPRWPYGRHPPAWTCPRAGSSPAGHRSGRRGLKEIIPTQVPDGGRARLPGSHRTGPLGARLTALRRPAPVAFFGGHRSPPLTAMSSPCEPRRGGPGSSPMFRRHGASPWAPTARLARSDAGLAKAKPGQRHEGEARSKTCPAWFCQLPATSLRQGQGLGRRRAGQYREPGPFSPGRDRAPWKPAWLGKACRWSFRLLLSTKSRSGTWSMTRWAKSGWPVTGQSEANYGQVKRTR